MSFFCYLFDVQCNKLAFFFLDQWGKKVIVSDAKISSDVFL